MMNIDTLNSTQNERPIVSPSEWRLIMKLVGLMAIANGRFTQEDMQSYQDMMTELRVVIDPKIVMTRKMILDWFSYNRAELTAVIDGLEYDSELIAIFKEMRNFAFKLDVVTAMMRVGIADGDYGRMEQMFVKKTILYWNVRGGVNASEPHNQSAPKHQRISAA